MSEAEQGPTFANEILSLGSFGFRKQIVPMPQLTVFESAVLCRFLGRQSHF